MGACPKIATQIGKNDDQTSDFEWSNFTILRQGHFGTPWNMAMDQWWSIPMISYDIFLILVFEMNIHKHQLFLGEQRVGLWALPKVCSMDAMAWWPVQEILGVQRNVVHATHAFSETHPWTKKKSSQYSLLAYCKSWLLIRSDFSAFQWAESHDFLYQWIIDEWYGYGSIPINTIFRGMNIHLPAILMFTRGTRFWHTAISGRFPADSVATCCGSTSTPSSRICCWKISVLKNFPLNIDHISIFMRQNHYFIYIYMYIYIYMCNTDKSIQTPNVFWIAFFPNSFNIHLLWPRAPGTCSPSRLASDVSADEISKKSFPLERQIPPEKLLVIERYVVARKWGAAPWKLPAYAAKHVGPIGENERCHQHQKGCGRRGDFSQQIETSWIQLPKFMGKVSLTRNTDRKMGGWTGDWDDQQW